MDEKEPVGPEQSTPVAAEIELYEALKSTGIDDDRALRTAQAVRVQAGHNIKETLEVHRREVDTTVAGVETNLTAKIDRVDTKVDRVDTKVDRVDTKVDRVETKLDGVKTELSAELKAMRKELNFYRWAFIVLIALVSLLIALVSFLIATGFIPVYERWLRHDSAPTQSVQAPVESDPPETAVPPESDPPEPPPQ